MNQVFLGDVCDITMGQAPKGDTYNFEQEGLPLIAGAGDFGELYPAATKYTSKPTKRCAKGDIIFCIRATIGDKNWADKEYCLGRGVAGLSPGEKLFSKYLWHCLPLVQRDLMKRAKGSTFKQVSRADIVELEIPLPPLPEQKRIAAILDKADAIRRKRQEATRLADTFLRSVFLKMFGSSRDLLKNWETKKIKDTGKVQLGRQRSPKYQTGKHTTPYVRVANVFEDRIDLTSLLSMDFDEKDFPKYKLHYGDILLNEGQSTELVGRPAMWRNEMPNCCYQNTLVRFQVDPDQLTPEYALHVFLLYFRSGSFAKISSKTSSVAHLGAGRFADMLMPLPPIARQKEFSSIVQQHTKLKENLMAVNTHLENLFSSLQQRAFRGDL